MARFYRLGLFVLLVGLCGSAFAAVGGWGWGENVSYSYFPAEARNGARKGPYPTAQAACSAYAGATQSDLSNATGAWAYGNVVGVISGTDRCDVTYKGWIRENPGTQYSYSIFQTMLFDPNAVDPKAAAKELAQQLGKEGELCGMGPMSMTVCYQGYNLKGSWSAVSSMNGGTDNGFCTFGPFTADGTTCTGTEVGAPGSAPTPCTGGKVPGTVNGVEVCVDPGTTSAPGGSSSGSSSGTDGSGNSTGSGSSSSGKDTTCTGDTCTTTTTTTTTTSGGGSSTSTTSTTQPKSTFCAENPGSPLCQSGSFSGSCGAAPACTGDAVQCAQARYVFEASCSLAKPSDDNAQLTAFATAAQNSEGDQTSNLPGNETVNIGSTTFDQTELLGAAAGMSDLDIEVWGKSVKLPFSMVNVWLARLGMVLQAVTFLLCIRIVTRG